MRLSDVSGLFDSRGPIISFAWKRTRGRFRLGLGLIRTIRSRSISQTTRSRLLRRPRDQIPRDSLKPSSCAASHVSTPRQCVQGRGRRRGGPRSGHGAAMPAAFVPVGVAAGESITPCVDDCLSSIQKHKRVTAAVYPVSALLNRLHQPSDVSTRPPPPPRSS